MPKTRTEDKNPFNGSENPFNVQPGQRWTTREYDEERIITIDRVQGGRAYAKNRANRTISIRLDRFHGKSKGWKRVTDNPTLQPGFVPVDE